MALYGSRVEYGLHCLVYLVDSAGEAKSSSIDLAEMQGLSQAYVAKLFTQLKNAGLLKATEGGGGGYQLARAATDISVFDVVEALEGDKPLFQCKEIRRNCALFGNTPPSWATKGLCSIHAVMREAELRMQQSLKEHSLADIAQRIEQKAPKTFPVEVKAWFENRSSRSHVKADD